MLNRHSFCSQDIWLAEGGVHPAWATTFHLSEVKGCGAFTTACLILAGRLGGKMQGLGVVSPFPTSFLGLVL